MTATRSGNDVFGDARIGKLKGKNIALVTNHSSLSSSWEWLPERLAAAGVCPKIIFSPEHGLFGSAKEGEAVDSHFDQHIGAEVRSLYGERREMDAEELVDIDTVIYDMQDAGVRFYTLISTLRSTLNACMKAGRRLLVLDRPDPLNGKTVRGPVLDESLTSFVGVDSIPLQYGMTPGELANYWSAGKDAVEVVLMRNWRRSMWYDDTALSFVAPSPNLPDLQSMMLYPGVAVLEGLNVSVGRGTTRPFKLVGAPWLDGRSLLDAVSQTDGFLARYARFRPGYGKYANEVCEGIELFVADREKANPVLLALKVLSHLSSLEGTEWTARGNRLWAEYITGVRHIDSRVSKENPEDLVRDWDRAALRFRKGAGISLMYS